MEFLGHKQQRGFTLQGVAGSEPTPIKRAVAELLIQEGFLALNRRDNETAIALFKKAREQMPEDDFIGFCIYISRTLEDIRLKSPVKVAHQCHCYCRDQYNRDAICETGSKEVSMDACSQPILTERQPVRCSGETAFTQLNVRREESKVCSSGCLSSEVTNVNSENMGELNGTFSDGNLPLRNHTKAGKYSMKSKDLAPSIRFHDVYGANDLSPKGKRNREGQMSKQETADPSLSKKSGSTGIDESHVAYDFHASCRENKDRGRNISGNGLQGNAIHKGTDLISETGAEDTGRPVVSEEDIADKEETGLSWHSAPDTGCNRRYKKSCFLRTGRVCFVVGVKVFKIAISFLFLLAAILLWLLSLIITILLRTLRMIGCFLFERITRLLQSWATYQWYAAAKRSLRSPRTLGKLPKSSEEAVRYLLESQKCDPLRILDVSNNADPEDIKAKYRRLAMLVHPDKCNIKGANEAFVILKTAFDALVNPNNDLKQEGSSSPATNASARGCDKFSTPLLCNACGKFHLMTLVNRTQLSARYCSCCCTYIYARNGEVWVEGWFKFAFWCYACVNSKIYDVTDWGRCNGFLDLPPNTHYAAGTCSFGSNAAERHSERYKASSSWDYGHANRAFHRGPATFVGKARRSCKRRKGGGGKSKG